MSDDTHSRQKVIVTPNGPYMVIGTMPLIEKRIINAEDGLPLEWEDGKTYSVPLIYKLCRCGGSGQKPFCDESHLENEFDGTETAGEFTYSSLAKAFEGVELTLLDAEKLCSGTSFCDRLGGTWQLIMSPDEADRNIAIEQACNCPSGRLVMMDNSTKKEIEPELEPSLGLVEGLKDGISGPIWVMGKIPVIGSDDTKYELRMRMTLCRCGESKNKPFCDGTHEDIAFHAELNPE